MVRGSLRTVARRVVERVGDLACAGDAFGATHRGYAKSSRRAPGRPRRSPETSPAVVRWTEVRDPATGASYWWNKATNQTTALGAAKPSGNVATEPPPVDALSSPFDRAGRPTVGLAIGQMFVFGFGGALGVTFISALVAAFGGGAKMEPKRRLAYALEAEKGIQAGAHRRGVAREGHAS
jgi:hypothetical protein